jgi:hypothetical protein
VGSDDETAAGAGVTMRLLLALVAAAAVGLLAGLAASAIAALMPCEGEGLVCKLNETIGAYAVLIWSGLGALVFGVILGVARNCRALLGGVALLIVPLALFVFGSLVEAWSTIGVEPYRNTRAVLTLLMPPLLVVIAQWKLLGVLLVGKGSREPATAEISRPSPIPPA